MRILLSLSMKIQRRKWLNRKQTIFKIEQNNLIYSSNLRLFLLRFITKSRKVQLINALKWIKTWKSIFLSDCVSFTKTKPYFSWSFFGWKLFVVGFCSTMRNILDVVKSIERKIVFWHKLIYAKSAFPDFEEMQFNVVENVRLCFSNRQLLEIESDRSNSICFVDWLRNETSNVKKEPKWKTMQNTKSKSH